jgi:hypothetical protein
MSQSQPLRDDVARYTSQIVAAYCERNGVDICGMQDLAVAISKSLVAISASSPSQKAEQAANTAGRAEPQGAIRFADERPRARPEHLGSAPVHAGGGAELTDPGRRSPADITGHAAHNVVSLALARAVRSHLNGRLCATARAEEIADRN